MPCRVFSVLQFLNYMARVLQHNNNKGCKMKQNSNSHSTTRRHMAPDAFKKRNAPRKIQNYIPSSDIAKIRTHLTKNEQFIFDLLLLTGMRLGEVFTWSDLKLHKRLSQNAVVMGDENKYGTLLSQIKYIDREEINKSMFIKTFKAACQKAKIDHSVHDIRYTCMANIIKSDAPMEMIHRLVGIKGEQFTKIYSQCLPEEHAKELLQLLTKEKGGN